MSKRLFEQLFDYVNLAPSEFARVSGLDAGTVSDLRAMPDRTWKKGRPPRRNISWKTFCHVCAKFGLQPVVTFQPLVKITTNEVE